MQNNIDIKINLETNNSENKIDKAKQSPIVLYFL